MRKRDYFYSMAIFLAFGLGMIIGARLDQQAVVTVLTAEHQVEIDRLGDRLAKVQTRLDNAMELLTLEGAASWYGDFEDGNKTTSGEIFDRRLLTAAVVWPLPLKVNYLVTNTKTGESLIIWANDRLPGKWHRLVDLSEAAARALGIVERGIVRVKIIPVTSAIGRPGEGD